MWFCAGFTDVLVNWTHDSRDWFTPWSEAKTWKRCQSLGHINSWQHWGRFWYSFIEFTSCCLWLRSRGSLVSQILGQHSKLHALKGASFGLPASFGVDGGFASRGQPELRIQESILDSWMLLMAREALLWVSAQTADAGPSSRGAHQDCRANPCAQFRRGYSTQMYRIGDYFSSITRKPLLILKKYRINVCN